MFDEQRLHEWREAQSVLLAASVRGRSMKREKSSNVICCLKKCSTIRTSKYGPNAKTASSLSYMQATAVSKSSSPFEDMHTQ